jgi:hypothetical protein
MQPNNQVLFFDIFQDTEDFLHNLNPKKYVPPFMTTVFSTTRSNAFKVFEEETQNDDEPTKRQKLFLFVSKFEGEYVEILRSKLREQYIDIILQKHYEIPNEINVKEVESYGAISELAQLSIAIAEWTLELEISAYTFEGLKLYGLLECEGTAKKDYFKLLKDEYGYKKKSTFLAMTQYLLRKALSFTFNKVSSLALAKGMSQGGFQAQDIINLIISISSSGVVPWKAVHDSLNITYMAGGFVCSHFFQKLNDYAIKKDVLTTVTHVQDTFETNKLHLMTERRTILDLLDRTLSEKDDDKYQWELDVLDETVKNILDPKHNTEHHTGLLHHLELADRSFKIKEDGDCVIVEEKGHKEKEDESGVIVVDW